MIEFGDERLPERFWNKVQPEPTTGCWLWSGYIDRGGYGRYALGERNQTGAHRLTYEFLVGPIPKRLAIDHLCRTPACCNPEHLEPVTNKVNVLRSEGLAAINSRKTHCVKGHPFSEANTGRGNGKRWCRACKRRRGAEYKARKAAANG